MRSGCFFVVASSVALSLTLCPVHATSAAVVTGGSATWTVNEGFASSLGWLDANFSEAQTRAQVLSPSHVSDAPYTRLSGASGVLGTSTTAGYGYTPGQVVVGDSTRPLGVAPLNDAGGTSAGQPGISRTRQPTTLDFDPNDILATWSQSTDSFGFTSANGEQIAFTNMQRWGGPFTGVLVYGDFGLRYNTANQLVLTSNIDFLNAEFATIGNATIRLVDSDTFQITGRLLTGEGLFILDTSAGIGTDFGSIVINVEFAPAIPNPCPADFNRDGFLDFTDFDAFVSSFELGDAQSDFNGDGFIDFTDFDAFVGAFESGC